MQETFRSEMKLWISSDMSVCVSVNPVCSTNHPIRSLTLVSSLYVYANANQYLSASFAQPIKSRILLVSYFFVCIWAFPFWLRTIWVRVALTASILLSLDTCTCYWFVSLCRCRLILFYHLVVDFYELFCSTL